MYSVFEKLMKEKGVSPADVSRATGIRQSALSDWKAGRYTFKAEKLKLIADYFGVTVNDLLGEPSDTIMPDQDVQELIKIAEALPKADVYAMLEQGRRLLAYYNALREFEEKKK